MELTLDGYIDINIPNIITWVTGEEQITGASGTTYYHLWHSDNSSKSSAGGGNYPDFTGNAWRERVSSSAYPTDWTDSGAIDAFQK